MPHLHDINNPLTVITLYIDSLGRSLADTDNLHGEHLQVVREEMDAIKGRSGTALIYRGVTSAISGIRREAGTTPA